MKKYFWFLSLFTLIFLNHIGFVAEANSFLNGAPSLLAKSDQLLDQATIPRTVGSEQVKVKVGAQFRHRFEYREDFNFNDQTFEDDPINLLRTRLNIELTLGPYLKGFAEGQDSESFASRSADKNEAFVNRLDLHQLYGEVKSPWEEIPVSVRAGRQKLSYGDQRFVGAFEWSNVARVFDAVKMMYTPFSWFKADAWFSQVVLVNRTRADSADHSDNFYGLYTTLGPYVDHLLDTFIFIRHNLNNEIVGEKAGERGQLKEYTFGNRFKGKRWNFDYGLEWAWQFGSRAHDDIRAFAWHNDLGYTFAFLPWEPRVDFEFNHGSGDSNPRDGNYENFDNLFPTNHIHYGYIDFFSLRNMNNIKVGTDLKPHSKVKLAFAYHWFFLDTNDSAWFNAGQAVVRPAKAGASHSVGQELDLTAAWKMMKHLNLLLGYSHFFTGAFVKDTGADDDANFFYVETTLNL